MKSDIYPVMEAYQYKIGLWNRLARRINLVFRTSQKVIVIIGDIDDFGEELAKRSMVKLTSKSCHTPRGLPHPNPHSPHSPAFCPTPKVHCGCVLYDLLG